MSFEDMAEASLSNVGSEEDTSVYCLPCDRDNIRVPAFGYCTNCLEHLCETCFKLHKRHKLSTDHLLLDKTGMPQSQHVPPAIHTAPKTQDELTQTCPKHKKEILKYYCQIHNVLLCSVCTTLKHNNTPCKVNYIPDISGKIVNSKEYLDLLTTMDTMINKCKTLIAMVGKNTALSKNSLTDVLSDIAKFRSEIDQKLDELAKEMAEIAKTVERKNKEAQQKIQRNCDNITKSLEEKGNSIKKLNTSKQSDKLFVEFKETEKVVESNRKQIQQLSVSDIKEYRFLPNDTIKSLFEKEKAIGTIVQKSITQSLPPPTVDLKPKKMTYLGEIYIQTQEDKQTCCITGICLINSVHLAISDHDNKSIKMIDTQKKSVVDELQLDANPWDVTLVTSTEIAVTLPNTKTIQFVELCSDKFMKNHFIDVSGHCQGLSCFQGKLVVTFSEPAKLQILEPNGNILTTVLGKNMFSYPEYVATSISSIYISDWKLKRITRLTWQGTVLGAFCDLDEPSGIALTEEGNVFVGDNNKHIVEEISEQCSEKQVVLKDPKCARAVCWCNEQKVLYFSSEDTKANNHLQMYIPSQKIGKV